MRGRRKTLAGEKYATEPSVGSVFGVRPGRGRNIYCLIFYAGRGKSGAVAWDFRRRPCTGLAEFTLAGPFSFWLPHLGVRAKQKNTCLVDYLRVPTTRLRVVVSG